MGPAITKKRDSVPRATWSNRAKFGLLCETDLVSGYRSAACRGRSARAMRFNRTGIGESTTRPVSASTRSDGRENPFKFHGLGTRASRALALATSLPLARSHCGWRFAVLRVAVAYESAHTPGLEVGLPQCGGRVWSQRFAAARRHVSWAGVRW